MEKVIAIVGATATGKSQVAIDLALKLQGEIVSADSAQVYRGLDIGTAKVTVGEMRGVPHHLIDIVGPETDYNAAMFCQDAKLAFKQIKTAGKYPILCGGSGLYINSLLYQGYDLGSTMGNPEKRAYYQGLEREKGAGYLYELLKTKFPVRASKIHPHDYQRILRALEMQEDIPVEGQNLWRTNYDLRIFGLSRNRASLYQAIEKRVDLMFAQGLVGEVQAALAAGYSPTGNAMAALGYKEILPLLRGEYTQDFASDLLKKNTRHFAKRQITWFKRDPNIKWLEVDDDTPQNIAQNIFMALKQEKYVN